MSIFDAPTTEQQVTVQTADTTNPQDPEDWLEKVVTEKGEHWKDPQTLAKGYAHAQARIKELEALEEKLKEQDYAKTLLEQLQNRQATEAVPPTPEVEEPTRDAEIPEHTSLSPEDIESLLEKTLSEREKQKQVEAALRDKFGANANVVVHNKAKELGLTIERMKEIANESPEAFLRLVGEPEQKQPNTQVRGTVNTSGFNSNTGERNAAYYANLRRTNRKLYDSLQSQMINDRVRLGEDFYAK